jgi:hypothetical protein
MNESEGNLRQASSAGTPATPLNQHIEAVQALSVDVLEPLRDVSVKVARSKSVRRSKESRSGFWGDQSERSAIIREALRTEPVNFQCVPRWVMRAIKAAVRAKRIPAPGYPFQNALEAFYHVTKQCRHDWWDHFGSIRVGGHMLFVSEPYAAAINSELIKSLEEFVALVGGVHTFSANSGHFPGETIRIVVAENADALLCYRHREDENTRIARG